MVLAAVRLRDSGRMERLRSIKVTIEVDTNKRTTVEEVTPFEDESLDEFKARVAEAIDASTELG